MQQTPSVIPDLGPDILEFVYVRFDPVLAQSWLPKRLPTAVGVKKAGGEGRKSGESGGRYRADHSQFRL